MLKRSFTIAILLLTAACNNPHTQTTKQVLSTNIPNDLSGFKWLIGKWQQKSADKISFENWMQLDDSTLQGISGSIKGKDTLIEETILLQKSINGIAYIPTVKDQNDGKPIVFKLTSATPNDFVFENPTHDFPQIISYVKKTDTSLLAKISGKINGNHNEIDFPMNRVE